MRMTVERQNQADTKDLTSSSKFSACCVLTLQTILYHDTPLPYSFIGVVLRLQRARVLITRSTTPIIGIRYNY